MKSNRTQNPRLIFLRPLVFAVTLLSACPGLTNNPNWYQIEVLAFTYVTPDKPSNEQWPREPELSYPEKARTLSDGEPWEVVEDHDWDTGFDIALRTPSPYQEVLERYLRRERQNIPDNLLIKVPVAYRSLEPGQLDFTTHARRMRNSRNYRVLLHQGWRQPVTDEAEASPVMLTGGRYGGDFPELQGSVRLHAGRYLHLSTRLWLNTDLALVQIGRAHV